MKRKQTQNSNGISISDSIIMSVKHKNSNPRKPFSVIITLIGFISFIMAFLSMYALPFNKGNVLFASLCILAFYITISVIGGKTLWLYLASFLFFIFAVYKKSKLLKSGYKFVYNFIYKVTFEKDIDYFKELKPSLMIPSITAIVIFVIWFVAMVMCFFTICRPNPVLPLLVTFPLLEIGLYNGVTISPFWGMLCIAYWLALLSMSSIDVGEYSGGQSGFVRKNNLFFPKRHMKLKVTERCGMLVICSVVATSFISMCFLKVTHYKRSDKINQKRHDISNAVEDFSFENLADSLSRLMISFGFDFDYENDRLGDKSHIRYKGETDLKITVAKPVTGAVYLKECTRAVYGIDHWEPLPEENYRCDLFDEFKEYNIYPQDYTALAYQMMNYTNNTNSIIIKPESRKSNKNYSPYNTVPTDNLGYLYDSVVSSPQNKNGETTYKLISNSIISSIHDSLSENEIITMFQCNISNITDKEWQDKIKSYCNEHDLITYDHFVNINCRDMLNSSLVSDNYKGILALLMQDEYKKFVYENYLSVPNTPEMEEIRKEFADVINNQDTRTTKNTLETLDKIRDRIFNECTYTLYPGKTPSTRDFVNYFLLENHKGFCTHYASSGVLLARMAGIPARYAKGYVIVGSDFDTGKVNEDGSVTVNVKDNRSHAWAEIYLDGVGWIPYEFTDGFSEDSIVPGSAKKTEPPTTTTTTGSTTSSVSKDHNTTSVSSTSSSSGNTSLVTVTTTKAGGVGGILGPSDQRFRSRIPWIIKFCLKLYLLVAILVGILLIRRRIITQFRNKRFTTGNVSSRIIKMYGYAERMLEVLGMQSQNGNYMSFAEEVEKGYAGVYFKDHEFEDFTQIALKTRYGNTVPTEEEADICYKTVKRLSNNLYNRTSLIEKIIIKYIYVL
ncbi:MAG: transglutaminase domain-containing protein [Ruminococcus sp.]|uniref:transglutaminase-like domain-containing protein n=1 Tax=Ruminococcus sp. TaxID=41978 RepID=UPI001B0876B5|nr:transglutaminase-like domain-containing protein [Ruminococcus sp.]MBO7474019.1 transglutaminase domain-containing protein [Ruminococcus sp.]